MLRVTKLGAARHNERGDGTQSFDNLLRLFELARMRVAGGEKAIGHCEIRSLLQGLEQLCCRVIEPAFEQESGGDCGQMRRESLAWIEALEIVEMFHRQIQVAGKDPEQPAPKPPA